MVYSLRNMASIYHSAPFLFICSISPLFLVFCYSVQVPCSLRVFEGYINFNTERIDQSVAWHQSSMITQFTNYMIVRGMTCGLHKSFGLSYCSPICTPLASSSTSIYLQVKTVMMKCHRPLCSKSPWLLQSRVPPCGTLVISSNMTKLAENPVVHLDVTLPPYLEFNFTIWKIISKRDPLAKPKCRNAPHLKVLERDSYGFKMRSRLCGNTPIQTIVSAVQTVRVTWNSAFPYEEDTSVCLSYQATSTGYARQYTPAYPLSFLANYLKDEFIDRGYNVGVFSRFDYIAILRHNIWNISKVLKPFVTYIFDKNMLSRYSTGGVLHRVWSITGSVYYVPQFALVNFSCAADMGNSIERPTLKIFDHPLAQYDPIWLVQSYMIGSPISCNTTVPSLLYNSSIGDLTLQLTAADNYAQIFGKVRYIAMSCPGNYCEMTVKNVSASKGKRFSMTSHGMTSHAGRIQQRILIARSAHETGFTAISNFSVRIHGLTHMPCYYGGLFIYELEPLTLIAKICTPWVANAWYYAVRRSGGTNGLFFNTRPILFVIKSYGEKLSVQLEGYTTISRCSGIVNAAFRDMVLKTEVSEIGKTMLLDVNRYAVKHVNGCFQLSHILTDGNYLTSDQRTVFSIYASHDSSSNLANHTIQASLNANIETPVEVKVVSSADQNSTIVFSAHESSRRTQSCSIFTVDLGLTDSNHFNFNESYVLSLLPGRRSYSVGFSAQCMVLGINPVITMEYIPTLTHSCLQADEMKRHVRAFATILRPDHNLVTFPSLICGKFQTFHPAGQSLTTIVIFNKPSFSPLCCILGLDIFFPKLHLSMLHSLVIEEHDFLATGPVLTFTRTEQSRITQFDYTSNMDAKDMFTGHRGNRHPGVENIAKCLDTS